MTDWRGLCEELLGTLENEGHAHWPGGPDGDPLIERARLALAQSEPEDDVAQLRATLEATAAQRRAEDDARALLAQAEPEVRGPSDEELLRLAREWNSGYKSIEFEFITDFARAVLARYGRPTPAPAGEAGELVAWLTEQAVRAADCKQPMAAGMLTWAAQVVGEHTELLGRCHAAPVAVLPDEAQVIEPTERTILVPVLAPVNEGDVIYWQPLPKWPTTALPLPNGKVES